mgnify:CR=1 FL=1
MRCSFDDSRDLKPEIPAADNVLIGPAETAFILLPFLVEECDLSNDDEIDNLVNKYEEKFGKIDIIVHSVAFASREALSGRFMEVTRDDFRVAMDISVYTLIAVVKKFERIMSDDASVVTLSYYGSEKVVPNYNVMGVAKAALEAAVRYLAVDLGKNGKRINAVSAGPIKTLSAAGISG